MRWKQAEKGGFFKPTAKILNVRSVGVLATERPGFYSMPLDLPFFALLLSKRKNSKQGFPIRHFASNDEYGGCNRAAVALLISVIPSEKERKRKAGK